MLNPQSRAADQVVSLDVQSQSPVKHFSCSEKCLCQSK